MTPPFVFVDVFVEEHAELPDGCILRFRTAGEPGNVRSLRYESEDGTEGVWRVEGEHADGRRGAARAVLVEGSGGGTALLVCGGEHGLRLIAPDGQRTIAEPYLLLTPDALLDE